jgi:hypothetical protein
LLRLVIDLSALQIASLVLLGWLERREREAMAYLIEENGLLRRTARQPPTSVDG